jgi:hypothetical protein
MVVMLQNEISQKKIALNTLMARDKKHCFLIESDFALKEFNPMKADTGSLSKIEVTSKRLKNNCLKSVED